MSPKLITTEETADYIRVTKATILRWCKEGRLPAVRVGHQWRIDLELLEKMLAAQIPWGSRR